ncbi:PREDICTED: cAMP-responsive element-binding protein-like 2 [Ceratosolen solmsi marchali]|uniref:cAMP-responsive element-binding protein-like 2 n=1 Tax=Ceratosolen solmsi marchali TaxID=326594 RepID=A0AAJ6YQT0_9HYME|nr:PREDICTED: cAMP-responsive element-binding protein-like 2 [Ceratosolen solmsi marchali]
MPGSLVGISNSEHHPEPIKSYFDPKCYIMDFEQPLINDIDTLRDEKKENGKRGRRPGRRSSDKSDIKAKLERSRQSARECRARKKLRYQYLEELVSDREKAVFALRKELEMYKTWSQELDLGHIPEGLPTLLEDFGTLKKEKNNN